jgi:hypothetical protein
MNKALEALEARIEVLEKEMRAAKLIWAAKEYQMRDNFTKCKTAAEYWKGKYEEEKNSRNSG